jgi:acid stress-induced BolA-like protein IbaG/YrbA
MMTAEQIEQILSNELTDAKISITGDGHHFEACIVTAEFIGQSLLNRQRRINQILTPWIAKGELHAISMKTLTPEEYMLKPLQNG